MPAAPSFIHSLWRAASGLLPARVPIRYASVTVIIFSASHSPKMPVYVSLVKWTDQRIKNYRDTVDRALISPAVVLGGEPLDERGDLGGHRWASGLVRVGPLPCDQATMPS